MKKVIIILILLLPILAHSQSRKTTITTLKTGPLTCRYYMETEPGKDTGYYAYCGFQNKEYTTITDIGSVFMYDKAELAKLISSLEQCLPLLAKKGTDISFKNKGYTLTIYDFTNSLYVYDENKYTILSQKEVAEWLTWLKDIEL